MDDLGDLEHPAERRPDVLLPSGTVPGHRDERRRNRRAVDELPGLRRAVAPGGLGHGRPWRADDRVLELAHPALRHGDVLGGCPAPRPGPRPRLRAAVGPGSRACLLYTSDAA